MVSTVPVPAAAKVLHAGETQNVNYAVPLWLRDEQVRVNTARVTGRIEPHPRREEPVAVACFGPSLRDTWEAVRAFPFVISCSGSHKFLVERGIIPAWHVEVDPRAHKVGLIGEPQHGTQYLIASTCHPSVFDHLEGYDVRLWHVFDATEDGRRLLPPGEWAITGGCDVGLRALTIAGFLGFRDVHVFGMDHSAGTDDVALDLRHADSHPNGGDPRKFAICEVEGVRYRTTPAMLAAAQSVAHELDMMPVVRCTFHGDGLCQALMRAYVPKPSDETRPFSDVVAISKPVLISAQYVDLNAQLHHENLAYGVGGGKHADTVKKLCETLKTTSVLDYGCGKGYLAKALSFPIWEYDPAIAEKRDQPRAADIVVCTDVLEHVEPELLDGVLNDLHRCVRQVGYFVIHTGPAQKTLSDGRNTHLIQRDAQWWRARLQRFFQIGTMKTVGPELYVVVGVKKTNKKALRTSARACQGHKRDVNRRRVRHLRSGRSLHRSVSRLRQTKRTRD